MFKEKELIILKTSINIHQLGLQVHKKFKFLALLIYACDNI